MTQQQQPQQQVIFAGDFQASSGIDEIAFHRPVLATSVQVVASGEAAHAELLPQFVGRTQTAPFQLEVYGRDLTQPNKQYFEQLLPAVLVPAGTGTFHAITTPIVTNHIILRGSYIGLSLVLYGHAMPLPGSNAPTPVPATATTAAFSPPPSAQSQSGASAFPLAAEAETKLPPPVTVATVDFTHGGQQPLTSPVPTAGASSSAAAASLQLPPDVKAAYSETPQQQQPAGPYVWAPAVLPALPQLLSSGASVSGAAAAAKEDPKAAAELAAWGVGASLQLRSLPQPTALLAQLDEADSFSPRCQLHVGVVETAVAAARRLRGAAEARAGLPSALRAAGASLKLCFASGLEAAVLRRKAGGRKVSSDSSLRGEVADDLVFSVLAALQWCTAATTTAGSTAGDNNSDAGAAAAAEIEQAVAEAAEAVKAARAALQLLEYALIAPRIAAQFVSAGGPEALRCVLATHSAPVTLKALAMTALAQLVQHDALLDDVLTGRRSSSSGSSSSSSTVYEAAVSAVVQWGPASTALRRSGQLVLTAAAVAHCAASVQSCALEAGLAAVGEAAVDSSCSSAAERLALVSKAVLGRDPTTAGAGSAGLPSWEPPAAPSMSPQPLIELTQALYTLEGLLARLCMPSRGVAVLCPQPLRPLDGSHSTAVELLEEQCAKPAVKSVDPAVDAQQQDQATPFSLALLRLLQKHNVVAALAAGAAAVGRAAAADASSGAASASSPLSTAASDLFCAVRALCVRLLQGGGDPLIGSLVFASAPAATEVLVSALDPALLSSTSSSGAGSGALSLEALQDALAEHAVLTPSALAHLLSSAVQAAAVAEAALVSDAPVDKMETRAAACLRQLAQLGATSGAGRGAAAAALCCSRHLLPLLLASKAAGAGAATSLLLLTTQLVGVDSTATAAALLKHWPAVSDAVFLQARSPQPVADWGTSELAAQLLELCGPFAAISRNGTAPAGLMKSARAACAALNEVFASTGDGLVLPAAETTAGGASEDAARQQQQQQQHNGNGYSAAAGAVKRELSADAEHGAAATADSNSNSGSGATVGLLCTELERLGKATEPLTTISLTAKMMCVLASASPRAAYCLHGEGAVAVALQLVQALTYVLSRGLNLALARRLRAERASVIVAATAAAASDSSAADSTSNGSSSPTKAELGAQNGSADAMAVEPNANGFAAATSSDTVAKVNATTAAAAAPAGAKQHKAWSGDAAVRDLIAPGPGDTAVEEMELWCSTAADAASDDSSSNAKVGRSSASSSSSSNSSAQPALSPAERWALAARHRQRTLTALLPAVRLLYTLLSDLCAAGVRDAGLRERSLAALLDAQAALAHLPTVPEPACGSSSSGSASEAAYCVPGATPLVVLAARIEALIAQTCRLWLPGSQWGESPADDLRVTDAAVSTDAASGTADSSSSTAADSMDVVAAEGQQPAADADAAAGETAAVEPAAMQLTSQQAAPMNGSDEQSSTLTCAEASLRAICAHTLALPAHYLGGARLLAVLLPPALPTPPNRLPPTLPHAAELALRVRSAPALERSEGLRQAALSDLDSRLTWHLRGWDSAIAGSSSNSSSDESSSSSSAAVAGVVTVLCHSACPPLRALSAQLAAQGTSTGPAAARAIAAALVTALRRCVEGYLAQTQSAGSSSSSGGACSWQSVCALLQAMQALAEAHGSAGRIALLGSGALDALLPCLGLSKPECIRGALTALAPFVRGGAGAAAELLRYASPHCPFAALATAARNVVAKWHRVDLHVHAGGAALVAALAASPACAADVLAALRPRGAEATGSAPVAEGKTTMLLPRLYGGLVKGLEDVQRKYRNRLSMGLEGEGGDAKRAEELDLRVLLLARAACWAVLAPLALLTEGLVEAVELMAVLVPQGTQRAAEPLSKLKAAVDSFVQLFAEVAPVLEGRLAAAAQERAVSSSSSSSSSAAAAADSPLLSLLGTRQYLTVLRDASEQLYAACEGVRGQRPSAEARAAAAATAASAAAAAAAASLQPLELWFSQRTLITDGPPPGGVLGETLQARLALFERGGCFNCEELSSGSSESGAHAAGLPGLELDARPCYRAERIDLPLVAAGGSAFADPAVTAARHRAVAEVVQRARKAEGLPADVWRVKQPKRARASASTAAAAAAIATVIPGAAAASSSGSAHNGSSGSEQAQTAAAAAAAVPAAPSDPRRRDPRLAAKKGGDPRRR